MAEEAAREAISDEEVAALLEKNDQEGANVVRPYDFVVTAHQPHAIAAARGHQQEFCANARAPRCAGLLGRDASMQFDSLESVKSADLQASLPVPASLAVVRLKPLPGFAYVSVEPALLLTLLDGFFGGSGRANADPQAADRARRAAIPHADAAQFRRGFGRRLGCPSRRSNWNS